MIETYWNEVFGDYKDSEGKFEIPGFPEIMMSAHFGVKNIVGPATGEIKHSFKLCVFGPKASKVESIVSCEPLQQAIASADLWDFQIKNNNETTSFMQRLLPFLASLPQPHYHFFIKNAEGICASTVVGVAESGCFLFNLSVDSKARHQGLAKKLIDEARGSFPEKPLFYWTVHPWFTYDSVTQEYHIMK